MKTNLSPSDALSPDGFYNLYLGALAIEDRSERRQACYVLLLLGRLGLDVDELLHLHDGWLDWERGTIHVPARDPCACRMCWNQARAQKERGDRRALAEIVREEYWSPTSETGARRLSFGWSQRLTGAIDSILAETPTFPGTRETVRQRLQDAADRARGIDSDRISVTTLYASAMAFLAEAGFGPRRLADLCATDESTAGAFVRVNGGDTHDHLYRALGDTEPPALCGERSPYQLVCDASEFEREPFDPTEFDAEWRTARDDQSAKRTRNPRPVEIPEDVQFDADRLGVTEPANDTGPHVVAKSLTDWVDTYPAPDWTIDGSESTAGTETRTGTGTDTGNSPQGASGDPIDSTVTEPVEFTVDTRFAAAGFESGRPTGGSVVLGQAELLFLSRDESGISGILTVDLDWIVNLKPGYTPDPLEGLFEDTVAIAYHDEVDERRVVVTEMLADVRWTFTRRILARILDGTEAIVTHRPAESTALGPEPRVLDATTDRLLLESTTDGPPVTIPLAMLGAVDYGTLDGEPGDEKGLTVEHTTHSGETTTTEIRPTADANIQLLNRYFTHYRDREHESVE